MDELSTRGNQQLVTASRSASRRPNRRGTGASPLSKHPIGGNQKTPGKTQVLVTRHKGGQIHKKRVSLEVAEVARRLQERANIDPNRMHNRLADVCEAHEIKPAVTPGAFRHSVATWLYNSGVPLAAISTFLGHASPITTKRFYAALGVAQNPMLSLVA